MSYKETIMSGVLAGCLVGLCIAADRANKAHKRINAIEQAVCVDGTNMVPLVTMKLQQHDAILQQLNANWVIYNQHQERMRKQAQANAAVEPKRKSLFGWSKSK